jgi:DNA (cytosine-5)-methyltransferase 1
MNAIDLFCGCGGASLGLKMAGYKVVGAVDNDLKACETYFENLDLQPICKDLRYLSGQKILDHYDLRRGDIDMVVGCPPCQGFSSLRRTRYSEETDSRKNLVAVFLRRIAEIQPRAVVFENVPGIAAKEGLRYYLGRFLRRMETMGYRSTWKMINAADFGVAQFRKRVFAFCAKTESRIVTPDKTHSDPKERGSFEPWKTVSDEIGNMPPLSPGESCSSIPNHRARTHSPKVLEIIRNIPKDGGSRKELPAALWLPCHQRLKIEKRGGAGNIYGRMAWDMPAPTITCRCTTPSSGRFVHPEQDRAITPREAARLQSFPDSFVFPDGSSIAERFIGNAVPAELMKVQLQSFETAF